MMIAIGCGLRTRCEQYPKYSLNRAPMNERKRVRALLMEKMATHGYLKWMASKEGKKRNSTGYIQRLGMR